MKNEWTKSFIHVIHDVVDIYLFHFNLLRFHLTKGDNSIPALLVIAIGTSGEWVIFQCDNISLRLII